MQTAVMISSQISHESGTHSLTAVVLIPELMNSLCCVYHFLLNPSLLMAWIIQLWVSVRQSGCPKAAVAPGGCRQFVMNPKYKPPDKSRIWG